MVREAMSNQTDASTSPKRNLIEQTLRARIVSGDLRPGSRLPTRSELEEQFVVSSVTVQLALDRLIEDGFVKAEGRRGTYVTEHPPHLFRYGICFPGYPSNHPGWSRFWTALANEALKFQGQPRRMALYHGIDHRSDTDDAQRLISDIQNQRLAGLIFAMHPYVIAGTPFMEDRGIPRVGFMGAAEGSGVGSVELDRDSFLNKALDYFQSRGRKRIAILMVPGLWPLFYDQIARGLALRGMSTQPYWGQLASPMAPETARNAVHLLMHNRSSESPDGLFISDDNLVEHAIAGLIAAGVRVPEDLDVVAHCNFPWPTPSVLPAKRLGYDSRLVLKNCISYIDKKRAGQVTPESLVVTAQYEDEAMNNAVSF